ncbi:hypothetical protein MEBOL_003550 [Melittangium boletus DSM 14713]|uniref:Uncharacterized protein n=2 Tax=Melittangium boletus TaxID=83453 RepID=A0A250IE99_9BACT|nr:hypothetical protein MEBOL_003550 [Melittangium boletus DSM 14713]
MEAFSALEYDRKGRKKFDRQVDEQISQLRRDNTSLNASAMIKSLEQAKLQHADLMNDVQDRLFDLLRELSSQATVVDTNPQTLLAALDNELIEGEPTDNLILHTILHHSQQRAAETKAFLSENTKSFEQPEVRAALVSSGIKFFSNSRSFLEWGSRHPSGF